MEHKMRTILAIAFLLSDLANGRGKDPDEDKAYEFGFTIEGMQHRHEKKDVNGIIQGEFGFITADGVYHVTVYATDENGNFRIISMKNIKVSPPLDGSPDFGSKQYSSIPKGQRTKSAQVAQPKISMQTIRPQELLKSSPTRRPNRAFTTQPTVRPACAGCGYVTTSRKPPANSVSSYDKPVATYPSDNPTDSSEKGKLFPGQKSGIPSAIYKPLNLSPGLEDSKPIGLKHNPKAPNPQISLFNAPSLSGLSGSNEQPKDLSGNVAPFGISEDMRRNDEMLGIPTLQNRFGNLSSGKPTGGYSGREPNLGDSFSTSPNRQNYSPTTNNNNTLKIVRNPVKVSNGLIHIPGNPDIPIKDKYPGMVDGLPAGIDEKDITNILYKFNWTVGFQGHYETGYKNGAKVGGYFVNGSDGISRVVTYVADEFGYRPKVRIINIGLDSPDTPKDDKSFELKSFEFVWYPVQ